MKQGRSARAREPGAKSGEARAAQRPSRPGPANRRLRLAVTTLTREPAAALVALATPGAADPLALGQALHARYQADALQSDPSFRAEVPLTGRLDQAGWQVEIHGRADGIRCLSSGRLCVEELKTLPPGNEPSAALRRSAQEQAALYAWLLARSQPHEVEARLVWLAADATTPPCTESVSLDFSELETRIRRRLALHLAAARRQRRDYATRRSLAPRLSLPHRVPRPGQDRISRAVEAALKQGEHLLCEAPTGLGKTAAVLVPALRFTLATDRTLSFLTAKTTQQSHALAVHAALGLGTDAPALQLRSRRAACLNDVLLCHPDPCRFARDPLRKLMQGDLVDRVLGLGAEALAEQARGAELCPHALARATLPRAALIVGDYNYALRPSPELASALPGAAGVLASSEAAPVLLLDEAHQVVERARSLASVRLDDTLLARAAASVAHGGAPVQRRLADVLGMLRTWLREHIQDAVGVPEGPFDLEWEIEADDLKTQRDALAECLTAYLAYRGETRSLEAEDPTLDAWRAVRDLAAALERAAGGSDGRFATLLGHSEAGAHVRVLCTDPSVELASLFARYHAVIGFSATLAPAEFHRDTLGLDPARTSTLSLPSPFPSRNLRLVIDPGVDTRAKARPRETPRIAHRLASLGAAVPGHTLALLSSFDLLEQVAAALPASCRVRLQPRSSGAEARRAWLEALRNPRPATLFLAVAGGIYAEGVDTAGGGLRAVAIVSPCLPPPDADRVLLARRYDELFDAGFEHAFARPGMIRVVQAAGRLIRGPGDRGVVALFGRRFLRRPYRDALPPHWLEGAEPEDRVGDPAAEALAFFREAAPLSPPLAPRRASPTPRG